MSSLSGVQVASRNVEDIADFFLKGSGGKETAVSLLESVISFIQSRKRPAEDSLTPGDSVKRQASGEGEAPDGQAVKVPAAVVATNNALERVKELTESVYMKDSVDSRNITFAVQVPDDVRLISVIIGEKGARVRSIAREMGCLIQVDKQSCPPTSPPPLRTIFFFGSVKAVLAGYTSLLVQLQKAHESKRGVPTGGPFETALAAMVDKLTIVVPSELVSHIIGKSGSLIKKTQNTSGCHINSESEREMLSARHTVYGRSMHLVGGIQNRIHAAYLLLRQLVEDSNLPETWKGMQTMMPLPIRTAGGVPPPVTGMGGPLTSPGIDHHPHLHHQPPPHQQHQSAHQHQATHQHPSNAYTPFINMKVPSKAVNFLIGAKGSGVSEIERSSQCSVQVSKPGPGEDTEREVTISGSPQGIDQAYRAVRQRVDEWERSQIPTPPLQYPAPPVQYQGQYQHQHVSPQHAIHSQASPQHESRPTYNQFSGISAPSLGMVPSSNYGSHSLPHQQQPPSHYQPPRR